MWRAVCFGASFATCEPPVAVEFLPVTGSDKNAICGGPIAVTEVFDEISRECFQFGRGIVSCAGSCMGEQIACNVLHSGDETINLSYRRIAYECSLQHIFKSIP